MSVCVYIYPKLLEEVDMKKKKKNGSMTIMTLNYIYIHIYIIKKKKKKKSVKSKRYKTSHLKKLIWKKKEFIALN